MTQTRLEGISNNCSILKHLNNYLNFADRLRLAQCSVRLRNHFESHIWPEKYETLQIYENADNFIVCNETDTNRLNLSCEEFNEFLNVYARDVMRLSDERNNIQDLEKFKSLLKLNLGKRAIECNLLDLVADNCPNLQELRVYITTSGPLETEEILHLDALVPMKSLKHLYVETDVNVKIHLRQFREFIAKTKLESFVLGATIVLEEPEDATWAKTLMFANRLKELDIIVTSKNANKLSHNLDWCLKNFENLQSLSLEFRSPLVMDNNNLRTICQICTKLQRLFINSTTVDAQEFPIPPMLEEISLHGCLGLTCKNLKQLLSAERITKFSSQYTQYKGNLTECHLPPKIAILKCDDWAACHLKYVFNANDNLKILKWHKPLENDNDIATDGRLVACGNLKEIVWRGSIPVKSLLQLTKLQRLTIALSFSDCSALLKHSSLQELMITKSWCDRHSLDISIEGVTTKLQMLHITLATMTDAIDYWLKLLQQNTKLSLICSYEPKDLQTKDGFLKQIIENANFPRDLSTLDIWGYKIDILKFKQQFTDTMDKLRHDTKYLSRLYKSNMHRIVLSRD